MAASWFQILEKAWFQYTKSDEGRARFGDPEKGATVAQAWQTIVAIAGIQPVCLAVDGEIPLDTTGIEEVIRLPPEELLSKLATVLSGPEPTATQIFYHDGKAGHSVSLLAYDGQAGSFAYHDPWPGRSLLCRENNAAGIDAQEAPDGRWRVTRKELESVICAAFVFPPDWAECNGRAWAVMRSDLEQTKFWAAFRIREVGSSAGDGVELRELKPGGFRDKIDIRLEQNPRGRVVKATLALARDFVDDPEKGVLASDIATGFLGALVSPLEKEQIAPFVECLRRIHKLHAVKELMERSGLASVLGPFVLTYMGQLDRTEMAFPLTSVTVQNVTVESASRLEFQVRL